MTVNLGKYYGVEVHHAEKIGPRRWQAFAKIFRRDNFDVIETFYTEGGTMTSADSKAISEAKHKVALFSIPLDWKDSKN